MFESGALHIATPYTPTSQRPDRLAVRGVTAAWTGGAAVLIVVGMWLQHSRLELASIVPLVFLAAAALALVLPLERVAHRWQAVGAWCAIVLVLGLELTFRIRAVDVVALVTLPLAVLFARGTSPRREAWTLVAGFVVALLLAFRAVSTG